MTDAEFIDVALSLPGVQRVTNHGRPGLAVGSKLFAGPGEGRGGVAAIKFSPEQQEMFCEVEPDIFHPDPKWGRSGWTSFDLNVADAATALSALTAAWRNVATKKMLKANPTL